MPTFLSFLLLPILLVAGWQIARRCGIGHYIQRALSTIALLWLLILGIAGLTRDTSDWMLELHRWGAHGLVIFMYLAAPFAIGARFGERAASAGFVFLLLALALLMLPASMTGYLNPTDQELAGNPVYEETHNRFVVVHMVVLPLLLIVLAAFWLRAAWKFSAQHLAELKAQQ